MVATTAVVPAFTAVNEGISPLPLAARPIVVLLFVQLYTVPGTDPLKFTAAVGDPLHTTWLLTGSTVGIGLTVTVKVQLAVLPAASVAVAVTVVVPTENTLPEAGAYETVTPGQLSVAVAL
jgi:hypothetical protein